MTHPAEDMIPQIAFMMWNGAGMSFISDFFMSMIGGLWSRFSGLPSGPTSVGAGGRAGGRAVDQDIAVGNAEMGSVFYRIRIPASGYVCGNGHRTQRSDLMAWVWSPA